MDNKQSKNDDDSKQQHVSTVAPNAGGDGADTASANDDYSGSNKAGGESSSTGSSAVDDSNQLSDAAGSGNGKNGNSRTFSQEDVTRMMTREKQQGRNAVFNELGIDPDDTKTIEMVKAIMASQKQSEEPPVVPSAELVEAQHRADVAEAKAEAMMMGAQAKFVDDIVTLATAKLQSSDEETDFKKVVSGVKEKYPVWFGEGNSRNAGTVGSKGTGSSISSISMTGTGSTKTSSLGQRLAAAKVPNKSSKSYWSHK